MKNKYLVLSLLCGALFFSVKPALAADWYVDATNGSDSASGTEAAPWKTLGKINSSSIAGGDTVYLKGVFDSTNLLVLDATIQGVSASNPTTIQNWVDETPILQLTGNEENNIDVTGNYFVISGLQFNNNDSFLTQSHSIYINSDSSFIQINNNTFKDAFAGVKLDTGANNITIDANAFANNYYGVALTNGDANTVTVTNNVFYNNTGVGIGGNTTTDLSIVNNTFYNASAGIYLVASTGLIENNIFVNHTDQAIGIGSTDVMTLDYNMFYNNTNVGTLIPSAVGEEYVSYSSLADWQVVGYDANSISDDPLFTSTTSGSEDFHLLGDSPAIDVGADLSAFVTTDYDGEARPQGSAFDIGYDENVVLDSNNDTPAQVKGVKVPSSYKKSTQAKVKWNETDNATSYVINLYKYKTKTGKYTAYKTYTISDATTYKTIKNLTAGTKYKVQVRAKNTVDGETYKGAWSDWYKFTTKK